MLLLFTGLLFSGALTFLFFCSTSSLVAFGQRLIIEPRIVVAYVKRNKKAPALNSKSSARKRAQRQFVFCSFTYCKVMVITKGY